MMRTMCATNRSRVRGPEASNRGMEVSRCISKNVLLLTFSVVILCGLYPLSLLVIAQARLPFQANRSMLTGAENKVVASLQVASTEGEYFQPRPPAASHDASTSTSSVVAASNNLSHRQNSDFDVSETPLLERPTPKVCRFYDC